MIFILISLASSSCHTQKKSRLLRHRDAEMENGGEFLRCYLYKRKIQSRKSEKNMGVLSLHVISLDMIKFSYTILL